MSDADGVARAASDPAIRDLPWFGAGFKDTDAAAWVHRAMDEWAAGRNRTFPITDVADACLGSVNLGRETEHGRELGYWILPAWRGQGIAAEAVSVVVEWANRSFPSSRIWARARLDNTASHRVLAKCGFREAYRGKLVYFARPAGNAP